MHLLLTPNRILDWILSLIMFYIAYRIVKRTRALQLLMGFGLVFLFYYIGNALELEIFGAIMQSLFTALIVALPIVFQPELREILGRLGSSQYYLTRYFAEREAESVDRIIVDSLFSMAGKRIGALLVWERKMDISRFSEQGTLLNADISRELIETIFFPDTPLHDGAVLLRDSKILSASCVLPLSDNRRISKSLGTRHRAGLGITEQTDAIALIVSEETGKVSLAYGGELKYDVTREFISGFLESNLGTRNMEQAFIPIHADTIRNLFRRKS